MKTKYNEFVNEKIDFSLFKDKEELDSMSKKQIDKFRVNFVTNMGYGGKVGDNEESKRYLKEISFYKDVRFKQDVYDMYQKWIDDYDTDKGKNNASEHIVRMLKKYGLDHMYYMSIISDFRELGEELQYIKGIDMNVPEEFKDKFKK